MPHIYVSYARGDDDCYVREFGANLAAALASMLDPPDDHRMVFLSGAGPPVPTAEVPWWSPPIVAALSSCKIFVALTSPRYFLSESCGQQWWVFQQRLNRYEAAAGRRAPLLIPLTWSPVNPPTSIDAPRQRDLLAYALPPGGLRQLVRLRSQRGSYRRFIKTLATRLAYRARAYAVPPGGPVPELGPTQPDHTQCDRTPRVRPQWAQTTQDHPQFPHIQWAQTRLSRTPSAFHVGPPQPPASSHRRDPTSTGRPLSWWTLRVHLVVVAGTRGEMQAVRQELGSYGEHRTDWAPYRATVPQSLAWHARAVAAERLLSAQITDLDELLPCLDTATVRNEIVVLLVDAWATTIDAHQQLLGTAIERDAPTLAVLVVADGDAETRRHDADLREAMLRTLPRLTAQTGWPPWPLRRVEDFNAELMGALERARHRIFREGPVFRHPPDPVPGRRPIPSAV